MQARLGLMLAKKELKEKAGVSIDIHNFKIINQVGAACIFSHFNCEAFATAHSSTAHYDPELFVGLAWRPKSEVISCEM